MNLKSRIFSEHIFIDIDNLPAFNAQKFFGWDFISTKMLFHFNMNSWAELQCAQMLCWSTRSESLLQRGTFMNQNCSCLTPLLNQAASAPYTNTGQVSVLSHLCLLSPLLYLLNWFKPLCLSTWPFWSPPGRPICQQNQSKTPLMFFPFAKVFFFFFEVSVPDIKVSKF